MGSSTFYTADVFASGYFKNSYGTLKNIKSELTFDVTDPKGFIEAPEFRIGNEKFQTVDDNIYIKYLTTNQENIPFEIKYKLRGLNVLSVQPFGTVSKIKINVKEDIYICPTVSIGMSEYPSCALDEQTLIELADVALYNAKNNGKNCVCEYNPNTGCILLPKSED